MNDDQRRTTDPPDSRLVDAFERLRARVRSCEPLTDAEAETWLRVHCSECDGFGTVAICARCPSCGGTGRRGLR